VKRSSDRILTTHTGSLPRPPQLRDAMLAREKGVPLDEGALAALIRSAVNDTVKQQLDRGVDVVSDGEASKPSYATYVRNRLTGFGGPPAPPRKRAENADFPGYQVSSNVEATIRFPMNDGPVEPRDTQAVQIDVANLKAALDGREADAFMPSVSPGQISRFMPTSYYGSHEQYVF